VTWSAPWALGLLALLPVIVVLHLRRRREVSVGSVVVWQRVADAATRSRIRWSLPPSTSSLLLQLLAVTLLALALARPVFGPATSETHLIIVIDGTLAMQASDVAPDRFRAALADASAAVAAHGESGPISVVHVTDRARIVAHANDAATAGTRLHELRPSEASADWAAVGTVLTYLGLRTGIVSIRLWTSPQAYEAAEATIAALLPENDRRIHVVGTPDGFVNAGLADVRLVPRGTVAGRWTVEGRLVSVGLPSEPVRLQVAFEPSGTSGFLVWGTSEVTPDRSGVAPFSMPIDLPDDGVLQVRIVGTDHLHSDDQVSLVARTVSDTRVLVIGPENASLDRAFLAIPGLALYRADVVPEDAGAYDLVVVDRDPIERAPSAVSTLYLGVAPPGAPFERVWVAEGERLRPDAWRPDHPVSRVSDWAALEVQGPVIVTDLAASTTLVRAGDTPLVKARTTSRGREVVVGFDVSASGWQAQIGYPSFVAAVVDWATPAVLLDHHAPCTVGRPCGLPAQAFQPDWSIVGESGELIASPAGTTTTANTGTVVWPEGVFERQFIPTRSGAFELRSSEGRIAIPVHPRPVVDRGTLVGDVAGPAVTERSDAAGAHSVRLPWRIFAGLGLLVIAVEAMRAGLGRERWLRPSRWRQHGRSRSILITGLSMIALVSGAAALFGAAWPSWSQHATSVVVTSSEVSAPDERSLVVTIGQPNTTPREGDRVAPDLAAAIDMIRSHLDGNAPSTLALAIGDGGAEVRSSIELGLFDDLGAAEVLLVRSSLDTPQVQFERLMQPDRVRAGDSFDLGVSIRNYGDVAVEVSMQLDASEPQHVGTAPPGTTRLDIPVTAPDEPGAVNIELWARASDGEAPAANHRGVLWVEPATHVLVVASDLTVGEGVGAILLEQGLRVHVDLPRRMPGTLDALSTYDVVVLADVPAVAVHTFHQELLETWVRDRAGGLVILGGSQSFGAGGYMLTPLDTISPLSSRVPDETPEVAMVLVLDRSGSMTAAVGDRTRLAVAQEATIGALDLLNPQSLVGIVAFDAGAEIIAPMTPVVDRATLDVAVARIRAGGGTDIYSGLVEALDLLRSVESGAMHVIVMTDGITQPGDFPGVLGEIRALGATVSFLGIGDGADQGQLRALADLGGGSLHMTRDFRALPAIMAQETTMASTTAIEETRLQPSWSEPRAPFSGGLPAETPPLDGYVRTTLKPAANLHLGDAEIDVPLLASWRYGAGRSAAFTSDVVGPWSAAWQADARYQALWGQLVRWAASDVARSGLKLRAWYEGVSLHLVVEALDEDARQVTALAPRVSVVDEGTQGLLRNLTLHERAPGRYVGRLIVPANEAGFRVVIDGGPDAPFFLRPLERTVSPPTSAADRTPAVDQSMLARSVGASLVTMDELPQRLTAPVIRMTWQGDSIHWLWLTVAALMAALFIRYGHLATRARSPR